MQSLAESIARLGALQQALVALDPPAASMLTKHIYALREIGGLLRECSIQMAVPGIDPKTATYLRDRIDVLLDITPRINPISQVDGS